MNDDRQANQDTYKSLLLLDEISKGRPLSQRDLSKKLNIALGLVNSYVKNLVAKGYVTVASAPAKKYAYFLTPKGFAEKTRLTYQHLQNFTNLYREARRDFSDLFRGLYQQGVRSVVFAGADEVAEIAYLTLQETDIRLSGVVDDQRAGQSFFRTVVMPYREINSLECDCIILTTFLKKDSVYRKLVENDVPHIKILTIYQIEPSAVGAMETKVVQHGGNDENA